MTFVMEFGAILDTTYGPGAGAAAANAYQELWDNPHVRPVMHVDMQPVLERLRVPMPSIRAWVSEHAAPFTPTQELRTPMIDEWQCHPVNTTARERMFFPGQDLTNLAVDATLSLMHEMPDVTPINRPDEASEAGEGIHRTLSRQLHSNDHVH